MFGPSAPPSDLPCSPQDVIALHRACGHLTMGLLSFHGVGYMVAWASTSLEHLLEELTDWLRAGWCERPSKPA